MSRIKILEHNPSLLAYLREHKIPIEAICNGKGTCGRCKVKMIGKAPELTEQEHALLSIDEINAGWRLACQHEAQAESEIELMDEKAFKILGAAIVHFHVRKIDEMIRIAIDIGTTTVVLLVIDPHGKVLQEIRFLNPQRAYGADVLSRIQHELENEAGMVRRVLVTKLTETLNKVSESYPKETFLIGFTGNPTMTHFLMNEPVAPIIQIPYSCSVKETRHTVIQELFPDVKMNGTLIVYPPISAYVGADIVCGLVDLDFFNRKGTHLFLDLGTNGELVLLKNGMAYSTSTAAGPAFEGGSLSCGCGSIDGAISDVFRNPDGSLGFETIGHASPSGICGSGYIALLGEIMGREMDESGYLSETVYLTPDLYLTQQDVRMFQLAKSAIRTGIEILLKRTNTDSKDIERFELAGGFGSGVSLHSALSIGLFPQELKDKCHIDGNTALKGTAKLLFHASQETLFDPTKVVSVELATEPALMDLFTEYLYFKTT
jgi:uncharacterized 2Fe-2S/4Fe-4S cluster protein (DUF4445 family)